MPDDSASRHRAIALWLVTSLDAGGRRARRSTITPRPDLDGVRIRHRGVRSATRTALPRILDEAFDEVDRIDRLMSHYKANSPLSRINHEAAQHPVAVAPELFDFIADAMRYHRESGGTFDITVGPLMKAWGFFRGEGRLPSDDELAAAHGVTSAALM